MARLLAGTAGRVSLVDILGGVPAEMFAKRVHTPPWAPQRAYSERGSKSSGGQHALMTGAVNVDAVCCTPALGVLTERNRG
jgi:hypothetical protein